MPATSLQIRGAQLQMQSFSPRLQQAVRLLQMSSADYSRALLDEAENNPFLEIDEGHDLEAGRLDLAAAVDNIWAAEGGTYESAREGRQHGDADAWDALQGITLPRSLKDHLRTQIGVLRLHEDPRAVAEAVINALDEDGFLRLSFEEIAVVLGPQTPALMQALREALSLVQSCDPVGVGARSVAECLLLQVATLAPGACRDLATLALAHHIDLIASQNLRRLATALGASLQATRQAVQCVRSLNARPAQAFDGNVALAIVPDVTARKVRGVWSARLNASALPRVQLNKACAGLMEKVGARVHPEMAGSLEHAKWTLNNVAQRLATILDVARAITTKQQLFFEYGPLAMKPLGLREIGDAVGVHPSTVSRAVHGKYMATPFGVIEMRRFFSRAMAHSTGSASAPAALKELVHALIQAAPADSPVSDADLTRQLAQQGFRIARRTVTKYRQGLGIASVDRRRSAVLSAGGPT